MLVGGKSIIGIGCKNSQTTMTTRLVVDSIVRDLAEATATTTAEEVVIPKWQPIFTILILILMFSVLILDRVGTVTESPQHLISRTGFAFVKVTDNCLRVESCVM